jgi:hypothetical protein
MAPDEDIEGGSVREDSEGGVEVEVEDGRKEASPAGTSSAKRKLDDISNGNATSNPGTSSTATRLNGTEVAAAAVAAAAAASEPPSSSSVASATASSITSSSTAAAAAASGGARPKIRKQQHPAVAEADHASSSEGTENGVYYHVDQLAPQNNCSGSRRGSDVDDLNEVRGGAASDDDFNVYTFNGVNGAAGGGGTGDDDSCNEFYVADLPKSFYQLEDVGSDSEGGSSTTATGVSGAGQSNLSTEVAALIQSEMMRPRLRLRPEETAGAVGGGGAAAAASDGNGRRRKKGNQRRSGADNNGRDSPAMDFLEMDFDGSADEEDESGDSDDSGQGGDENVTETNEEDDESPEDEALQPLQHENQVEAAVAANVESVQQQPLRRVSGECDTAQQNESSSTPSPPPPPLTPPPPALSIVPNQLPLGEKSKNAMGDSSAMHATSAATSSVPAVTPVREDLGNSLFMVRSQSLNSPLVGQPLTTSCCIGRGESDPGGVRIRHRRRLSGEQVIASSPSTTAFAADPLLNMQICGARLSQREALMFGVMDNVQQALVRLQMDSGSQMPSSSSHSRVLREKTMIWAELEACRRQVTQIGVSACGATAVINALLALDVPHTAAEVATDVKTRLREEEASLPKYLLSRSSAGATHRELISALENHHSVRCRFFHMFPRRRIDISFWLADWIKKGAAPIATLNLQRGVKTGQTIPDAWHHQMIFGVGPNGVYLTNPLDCVSEDLISEQLCSPSELLVRRADVLYRFDPSTCDLSELTVCRDERWDEYNVLGQVVNLMREAGSKSMQKVKTEHVRIPAEYMSGVTLVMQESNPHLHELLHGPELPLWEEEMEENWGAVSSFI